MHYPICYIRKSGTISNAKEAESKRLRCIHAKTRSHINSKMIYTDTVHVVADTIDELHEFAEKIGMPRNYYEGVRKGHPHYDLRRGMTKEDIRKGGRIYLALAAGAQFRNKKAILQLSWKMLENEETQKQVEKEKTFFFQDWKKI